ncbi:MAG TPA: tryptophan synthase subunit alpha [Armatimonadota bacterium]|jgi:tryptophan synthase alpha chain
MALPEVFARTAAEGRAALIIYVTAGDPSLAATVEIVDRIAQAGADIVELGIPYSDPLADGPLIQAAGQRALRAGTTVAGVLEAARQIHERCAVPLLVMTCYNPILQFGPEQFAERAAAAGIAAVLISDLPPEESEEWVGIAAAHGLETIFLVAPTTEPERMELVCRLSTGFVYVVSRPGTTGVREDLPPDLSGLLERLRGLTDRPLAVGFGLSTPEQVAVVARQADGAIVGSAVVKLIAESPSGEARLRAVESFVRRLAEATRRD